MQSQHLDTDVLVLRQRLQHAPDLARFHVFDPPRPLRIDALFLVLQLAHGRGDVARCVAKVLVPDRRPDLVRVVQHVLLVHGDA